MLRHWLTCLLLCQTIPMHRMQVSAFFFSLAPDLTVVTGCGGGSPRNVFKSAEPRKRPEYDPILDCCKVNMAASALNARESLWLSRSLSTLVQPVSTGLPKCNRWTQAVVNIGCPSAGISACLERDYPHGPTSVACMLSMLATVYERLLKCRCDACVKVANVQCVSEYACYV